MTDDERARRAAWDAIPHWRRVLMCARASWLDAVWEAYPPLGRWLDRRLHGDR